MTRTTARGTCALCGYRSSKAGITRHLKSCPSAHDGTQGRPAKLFHLRAEDAESPLYWLDLEVKKGAALADLDAFLRAVWLECCGHLSMFKIGPARYTVDYGTDYGSPFEDSDERGMGTKLGEALEPGLVFSHEYDFGSTTYLELKVVGEREGRIGREPLRLLARNDAPSWECSVCSAAATQINTEAMWEEGNPFYCDQHAEGEEWAFLPVVNSPRMGVCGYTGALER